MTEEVWTIPEKDWDEWVEANPRLKELNFAIWVTSTKWKTYKIGWVEVKKND